MARVGDQTFGICPEYIGHDLPEYLCVDKVNPGSTIPYRRVFFLGSDAHTQLPGEGYREWRSNAERLRHRPFRLLRFIFHTHNLTHPLEPPKSEAEKLKDRQTIADVFSTLHLPVDYLNKACTSTRFEHGSFPDPDSRDIPRTFFFCGRGLCFIWGCEASFRETGVRRAVLFQNASLPKQDFGQWSGILETLLRANSDNLDHPMLLAYVFARTYVRSLEASCDDSALKLSKIEDEMGFASPERYKTQNELMPDQKMNLTQQLRTIGRAAIEDSYNLRGLQKLLDLAQRVSTEYEGIPAVAAAAAGSGSGHRFLKERFADVRSAAELDQDFSNSLSQRVSNQMAAIFNLINMQDTDVSVQIARDGKTLSMQSQRDSASMKTLAVVTMFFLPGTFVASFLTLPMFRWDAVDMRDVVSARFWVYWIVTVPLTASVLLLWWMWLRMKAARETRENEEAQRRLFKAKPGRSRGP